MSWRLADDGDAFQVWRLLDRKVPFADIVDRISLDAVRVAEVGGEAVEVELL